MKRRLEWVVLMAPVPKPPYRRNKPRRRLLGACLRALHARCPVITEYGNECRCRCHGGA